MRVLRRIILILILLIIFIYVTNITSIPNEIVLFKGENLELGNIFGVYIKEKDKEQIVQTSSNANSDIAVKKDTVILSLFNLLNVKEIQINTIPEASVIPLGNSIRIKALYHSEYWLLE